jgi:hypothetical protein
MMALPTIFSVYFAEGMDVTKLISKIPQARHIFTVQKNPKNSKKRLVNPLKAVIGFILTPSLIHVNNMEVIFTANICIYSNNLVIMLTTTII